MVTTHGQLMNWLRFHPSFVGVFARDGFIEYMRYTRLLDNCCFIVNTDTGNLPGRHWVAIYVRGLRTYYFDPAGGIPISQICRAIKGTILHNVKHYQNLTDPFCGEHCVFFLYQSVPAINDHIAVSYVNKHLI